MNSTIIKCLLVDDEPPAIRLLEEYLDKVTFLKKEAIAHKALDALQILEEEDIDLIFLDIQMPDLSGIQLSRIIKDNVKIIFTTAYPQFALESYDLNAIDYLLKPFEFERFYKAVLKVKQRVTPTHKTEKSTKNTIFIKTEGKNNYEKILIEEIYYIEALKNYVAIHSKSKQIITYSTLKNMQESLKNENFVRIHKSYIVSMDHILKTDTFSVFINNVELPISDTYRKIFFKTIKKHQL